MWGVGVNASTSSNEQVSNVYNEAQKYTDQSVKDTMIQNYITNITTRNEDVTELVKNFENNVSAEADSVQRNTMRFAGCIKVKDINKAQVNELVQDVKQGFEKLNEDTKTLKRVLESTSDTSTTAEQGSTNAQGASAETGQTVDVGQSSSQTTEQKAGFTALSYFSKHSMREPFVSHSSFPQLVRKNKHISIREHFASYLNSHERFCLFGCVDVNKSDSTSSQISNATNIDLQTNIQTQDIYKKIETAYDKTVETITKISEVVNETTNSIAAASSIQINEFIVENEHDSCMLELSNISGDQKNKLEQDVELTTAIHSINSLTTDSEVKAIMTDMMGLTQSSETKQDATTKTEQVDKIKQDNEQKTKQVAEVGGGTMGMITIIIVAIVVGGFIFMFMKSKKSKDSYFDGSPEIGKADVSERVKE